jgi:hypothetical protein
VTHVHAENPLDDRSGMVGMAATIRDEKARILLLRRFQALHT